MPRNVYVIGVGLTAFAKPRNQIDYPELAVEAATKALLDAGINYDSIEQAYASYVYGDSCSGQRALYALGMTGIPIINVNNNCSSGSSAFYLASQIVALGGCECTMAVGFEKMMPGSLSSMWKDRAPPLDKSVTLTSEIVGLSKGPMAAQLFGNGGEEYCQKYGSTWTHIAAIAAKNHTHSTLNPYSQFRNAMTTEQVLADNRVTNFMTRAMCCPTSDGGACVIVASENFVHKHKLENQAIEISALEMATDSVKLFEARSAIEITGADMTRIASARAYKAAGIRPNDISVVELHDCFAANELLTYDSLQLTAPGRAHDFVTSGEFKKVNVSGGLESKGHPLGATGLGMVFYIVAQLRGKADQMQLEETKPGVAEAKGKEAYGLSHNLGLGGSCVVSILKRPSFFKQGGEDGVERLGYNHHAECRRISQAEVDRVKSMKASSPWADVSF